MPETKTSTRPTINVRPVAVGALNTGTVAGATIVAVGGPIALAAVAAGAAGVATVAGARRKAKGSAAKRERKYALEFGRTSTTGGPRSGGSSGLGRSGAASPGRRPPGSKPSPFPRSNGGGGGGTRGKSSLFGGPTRKRPAGSGGGSGHRRAGTERGSNRRGPLTADKVAAARHKLAKRRQPGPRLSTAIRDALKPTPDGRKPTARQAWTAARQAVAGKHPKRRGTIRRAVAGLTAAGVAAGKVAWDARRRRKKVAAARAAKAARIQQRRVQDTVRRPADARTQQRPPVPAPKPVAGRTARPAPNLNSPSYDTSTSGGTMSSPSAMAQMLNLAEQMVEIAAKFQRPDGVMELLDREYKMLPEVQRTVARAWKAMHIRATDPVTGDPLPPVVMDLLDELYRHQIRNAETADQIVPLAKRLEQAKIDALADPRNRMWDHRANRDHAS